MSKNKYGFNWIYRKSKGVRLGLAVYAALALCIPAVQLGFAFFMKMFIDIATGASELSLSYAAICSIALVAGGGIVVVINAVLSKWIYGKIECGARTELMGIIFSRCMIDIVRQHTGELLTKLTADVAAISSCFKIIIDNVAAGAVSALLATAALFFLNWKIAAILLVLTPIMMFVTGAFTPRIQKAAMSDKQNDEANRSMMQENLGRIMLVKTYFMQEKVIGKAASLYGNKLKSGMGLGLWEGLAALSGTLFGNMMFLVTLGLGSYFVLTGETTVGSLIAIVQLLNYIINPIMKFPEAIAGMGQAAASASRIGMIYELPAERKLPTASPVDVAELIAKDLSFSYGGENENSEGRSLLDGINMTFSKGEVTAIVGKNGSGKSTLLKLLIGLYTPKAGTIELRHTSGVLTGEEIMPQTAFVPPEDYLFSGSISDNIVMAEPKPQYSELQAAARDANIDKFIETLPNGFDTQMGEGGGTVSSGQAGRIAIARAIYKKAGVIVFDEPTANLDAESIEKFGVAVKRLAKDRICIIATHDSSTMTVCDKIYVLEDGRMREKHNVMNL